MSQLSYGYHMDMLRLSYDKGLICFRKRDREGAKTDAGIYCAERVKGEKKEGKRHERDERHREQKDKHNKKQVEKFQFQLFCVKTCIIYVVLRKFLRVGFVYLYFFL